MRRSLHSSSTRRLFGLLSLRRPEQWQEVSQAAIVRCVHQRCTFAQPVVYTHYMSHPCMCMQMQGPCVRTAGAAAISGHDPQPGRDI